MTANRIDIAALRMLFANWLMQLGRDAGLPFSQYGSSGDSFTIGSPNKLNVIAHYTETEPYLRFVSSNPSQQPLIDALAIEAASRVKQANFGSTVWHSTMCPATDYQIDAQSEERALCTQSSRSGAYSSTCTLCRQLLSPHRPRCTRNHRSHLQLCTWPSCLVATLRFSHSPASTSASRSSLSLVSQAALSAFNGFDPHF